MPDIHQNYVNGEWVGSETGDTIESWNPADPSDLIGEYQRSSEADAKSAIEAAAKASDEWTNTPGPERGRILRAIGAELDARSENIVETLVREEGKAYPEAAGEVGRAIDIFYYYAEKARDRGGEVKQSSSRNTRLQTREQPLGVATIITPWNYPIAIPAWKIAPAIAAGNTLVWNPASETPEVARKLVECFESAGLHDGVVNYVTGPGSEIGDSLIKHDAVDAVSFTGSTAVGKHVYQTATNNEKRVQTEMGGKNPTLVTDSADPEEAAEIVASGAFGVTGQACTATSRAIVDETVYDDFLDALVKQVETIDVGPGLGGYDMGPQVNVDELESTLTYIDEAIEDGNELIAGGGVPEGDHVADGYFVEPTVFGDVDRDDTIAQEEVFGPLVAVIPSSGFREGLEIANDVQYGLSTSIVSKDNTEINQFIEEAEAGVVKINEKTTGLELHVPFGGLKHSSSNTYREQGDAGLDFFTTTKTVYHSY